MQAARKKSYSVIITAIIAICTALSFLMPCINIAASAEANAQRDSFLMITTFVGADETEMNFNWHASKVLTRETQYVYITEWSGDIPEEFPVDALEVEASYHADAFVGHSGAYAYYRATVKGLKPNTRYIYQVGDGYTQYSTIYDFTTASDGNNFNFVVLGDAQLGTTGNLSADAVSWENTLTTAVTQFGPDFIMHMGDEVESWMGGENNKYDSEEQYQVFYGTKVTSTTPMATVIGNHEVSKDNWSEHHNHPNQTTYANSATGGDQAADYWYVVGNVQFFVLNGNGKNEDHDTFMAEAIAAAQAKYGNRITWRVVAIHQSFFGSNKFMLEDAAKERQQVIAPTMKKYGVDLVLMAHEHVYSRTYMMDGTTPIVTEEPEYRAVNTDNTLYVTLGSSTGNKCFLAGLVLDEEGNRREDAPDYIAYYNESVFERNDPKNVGTPGKAQLTNVSVSKGKLTISSYVRNDPDPDDPESVEALTLFDEFTLYKVDDPKITVSGGNEIKVGESFDPMNGVKATCEIDGDLTDKITVSGSVDSSKAGSYKLTYSVTNSLGKTTTVERTVTVSEKKKDGGCGSSVGATASVAAAAIILLLSAAAIAVKKKFGMRNA